MCSHPDRCGASADRAPRTRGLGCREAGAEAQTLFQAPRWAVLDPAHRCASLAGSAYDVGLTAASVGGERGALERGLVNKAEVDGLG